MNLLSEILIKFAYVPITLLAIYTAVLYKKLPAELRIFSRYIFVSAVVQLASAALWFNSLNNLWMLHIYVAIGFVVLTNFYNAVFKGFANPRIINGVAVLLVIFTIVNATFIQGWLNYASNSLTVESVLIVIYCLSTYILLLDQTVKESKEALMKSLHWINTGLFIYYSSSLLLFYFGDMIIQRFSRALNLYTWSFHIIFMFTMYLCFLIGLWKRPKV